MPFDKSKKKTLSDENFDSFGCGDLFEFKAEWLKRGKSFPEKFAVTENKVNNARQKAKYCIFEYYIFVHHLVIYPGANPL